MIQSNAYLDKINNINKSKYSLWYSAIIKNALKRATTKKEAKSILGYTEGHHILPRCVSSKEESSDRQNIVFLSAREHYLCHWLLTKIFTESNTKFKLACAFFKMCNQINNNQQRVNSKYYDYAKRIHSAEKSKAYKGKKRGPVNYSSDGMQSKVQNALNTQLYLKMNPDVEQQRRYKISSTLKGRQPSQNSLANLQIDNYTRTRGRKKGLMHRKVFGAKNNKIRIETDDACFYTYAQAMEFYSISESAVKCRIWSKKPKFASWKLIKLESI